ncbi:MAG TPA: VCBS repeat-containing protein, partial [Gemmataceae bacterium]|nr:VCBS repeat-containing protein [Gemmataceae bacterium]
GSQSITATDTVTSAITGNSATTVAAGAATNYSVSAPASAGLGAAFNVTVAAKDAFGNTATSYTGTVHFTSSDGAAVLPANYNFVAGDNGSHSFTVTMNTAGTQSVTATDTVTGSINGSKNITIGGTSPPPSPQPFAIGSLPGTTATVTMYNADHTVHFTSQPFGAGYTGGMRVAVGDVTGDGVADVVAVSNGGIPAKAKVINGATGLLVSGNLLAGSTYTGKISVAVGDVDNDGKADVVLGTNEGGSPRVRVFHGGDFAKIKGFSAGPTTGFIGRTTVGVGDMNNDGKADIVVSALYTGRTRVAGFSGASIAPGMTPTSVFTKFALTGDYVSGLFLAVGDVNGDGRADLVVGSPQTKTSNVTVFSGKDLVDNNTRTAIASFTPPNSKKRTGEKVAVRDIDGDGTMEILTSSGEMVSAFQGGVSLPATGLPAVLFSFDPAPTINGGVWVG